MTDGTNLTVIGEPLLSDERDLAAIPVQCVPGRFALSLAVTEPRMGVMVKGISYREKNVVGMACEVQEKRTHGYESNCPGTHGFSGAGYLDLSGDLTVIHSGAGNFSHFAGGSVNEELMQSSIEYDWRLTNETCIRAWTAGHAPDTKMNQTDFMQCLNRLRESFELSSRNPRTRMAAAVHLIALVERGRAVRLPRDLLVHNNGAVDLVTRG
jgi:hypothetical protein